MQKQRFSYRSYILSALMVVIGCAGTPVVHAELKQTGHYWGLMYSDLNLDVEDKEDSADSTESSGGNVKGKYGYMLSDIVSFEAHVGFTDTEELPEMWTYGGYMRANWTLDGYQVYGLLGASGVRIDDFDYSESGGSYGVGLEIFGSKTVAISIEYLTLYKESYEVSDITVETLGLGFTYYFVDDTSQFNKNRNRIKSIRY